MEAGRAARGKAGFVRARGQMRSGISLAFAQITTVFVLTGRPWIFACWLALTAASAVGGWHFGRSVSTEAMAREREARPSRDHTAKPAFSEESPQKQWARRVKSAAPADFPGLLDEWKALFPDVSDGVESQQENSLRWLLAQWLVKDHEGFLKVVTDKDFKSPHQAALVIARLSPDLISALRQLFPETGGDDSPHRKAGSDFIRGVCDCYSAESCIDTARRWAAERKGGSDDEIFKCLARRSAAMDSDKAEAALDSLPESARAVFAAEIVKMLPPEEVGRRLDLLGRLAPEQWDEDLGESLGKQGADFADAIFNLPASTTSAAQESFMAAWVEDDPDAALQWLCTLPQNEDFRPAALGFFEGWASFDLHAAIAWADLLPEGSFRRAVAPSVTRWLAENSPREAWRWAASIADPGARAEAYDEISRIHGDGAPAEFNNERQAAKRAAGRE